MKIIWYGIVAVNGYAFIWHLFMISAGYDEYYMRLTINLFVYLLCLFGLHRGEEYRQMKNLRKRLNKFWVI